MLMKAIVEMKSTHEENEDAIMKKWKDALLRGVPKTTRCKKAI